MAVKHAEAKKKVLTEIMHLMTKVGGKKLHGKSPISGEGSEPEETDDAPGDQEPKAPSFTWAEGDHHDDQPSGDEEDAPSDDELDEMAAKHAALTAKLAKHGRA